MTSGEILTVLEKTVEDGLIDECGVRSGVPYYYQSFETYGDEEPHDVAWSRSCAVGEFLEPFGLIHTDTWSDNDSFGGNVAPGAVE